MQRVEQDGDFRIVQGLPIEFSKGPFRGYPCHREMKMGAGTGGLLSCFREGCDDFSLADPFPRLDVVRGLHVPVHGPEPSSVAVIDCMAHVHGLSEIVLLDLGDLPVEHCRNPCGFAESHGLTVLVRVQAKVDSLVGAGTCASVPPPFLAGPEEHARMEGPPVEPGLAQPIALQQLLAELGSFLGKSKVHGSRALPFFLQNAPEASMNLKSMESHGSSLLREGPADAQSKTHLA